MYICLLKPTKLLFFVLSPYKIAKASAHVYAIRPSQYVSFPIALSLLKVGRSVGQKKHKKQTTTTKKTKNKEE